MTVPQFLDGAIEADYTFLMGDHNYRTDLRLGDAKVQGGCHVHPTLLARPASPSGAAPRWGRGRGGGWRGERADFHRPQPRADHDAHWDEVKALVRAPSPRRSRPPLAVLLRSCPCAASTKHHGLHR